MRRFLSRSLFSKVDEGVISRGILVSMDIVKEARSLLVSNRRVTDGHQYTVPSPGTYPYQWLWDSCFHAIVLASFDPDAAKEELKSLLSKQFPDGMLPHIIFWKPTLTRPYFVAWGKKGTSSITQPPMIAYAAWEIYRRTGDQSFLEEIYQPLLSYYQCIIGTRDPQDHHLAGIINPDESGEDNSPRFDAAIHVPSDVGFFTHIRRRLQLVRDNRTCNFEAAICMSRNFWVKDVPFNSILVKNLQILARIASLLGHQKGDDFAMLHAGLVKTAMRERLLADGVFWSAMDHDYKPIAIATWAHFTPLFADLYTPEEARALVEKHFRNEATFRSAFGIRTVSKQEPAYRPDSFWRGPVWMAPHWFIHKGLTAYGFFNEAKEILEASTTLIEKNGFREYFSPETGRGYGARDFTWGTLILDMMGI